jgi:hypothetical protein
MSMQPWPRVPAATAPVEKKMFHKGWSYGDVRAFVPAGARGFCRFPIAHDMESVGGPIGVVAHSPA